MRFDHLQIIKARKLACLTQWELAEKAGVKQTIVSRVELGRNQSAKTFKKLARALKLRMEDLLVEDDELTGVRR